MQARVTVLTCSALAAVVALGAGEASGAYVTTGAHQTGGTASACLTGVAVTSNRALRASGACGADRANGSNRTSVALVTFDTLSTLRTTPTLGANRSGNTREPSRASQTPRAHSTPRSNSSTGTVVALGAARAFLPDLAVSSHITSRPSHSSSASGANSSWQTPRALRAVTPVLARSSSVALRSDSALLAGQTLVALGAHQSVPASVSSGSASAARTVETVQAWQTPRALQQQCYPQHVTRHTLSFAASPARRPCRWCPLGRVRPVGPLTREGLEHQCRLCLPCAHGGRQRQEHLDDQCHPCLP